MHLQKSKHLIHSNLDYVHFTYGIEKNDLKVRFYMFRIFIKIRMCMKPKLIKILKLLFEL